MALGRAAACAETGHAKLATSAPARAAGGKPRRPAPPWAANAIRARLGDRALALLQPGGGAQGGGLVRLLPGEVVVLAAEVPVGGGLLVDRPVQVEVAPDRGRAQVEVLAD